MTPAAFAIPGDMRQKTGGYIYEASLFDALRAAGRRVDHVPLPGSFPAPDAADMAQAVARLAALPAGVPLILDGLVYGAIDTAGLAEVRAPLVAMIHHPLGLETGLPPDRARMLLAREAANLALARHVLVPSPHTARVLAGDFGVPPARITVAPPGFPRRAGMSGPSGRARPAGGLPPVAGEPPLILSVGLLAARKGHDVLLRALARVADLRWQAVIVGKTHDAAVADDLRALALMPGLGGRVRLAGEVTDDTLADLYCRAQVFALATRYEGYGMAFAEAMQHGLPIVGCATGAVPGTVPATAGLLVPPGDPAAFGDALARVLTDDRLRARLAAGSAAAGAALPVWADTAAIAGAVLDRLAAQG
jgi:glycosyltransferase involved in cell wall biosynthesis